MSKKKNAQQKLLKELESQLMIQAERLGIRGRYTPVYLEELRLDSLNRILTEFYMERANLEYELNTFGSEKRELLIKLERLNAYIVKALALKERANQQFQKLLDKGCGEKAKAQKAVSKLNPVRVRAAA